MDNLFPHNVLRMLVMAAGLCCLGNGAAGAKGQWLSITPGTPPAVRPATLAEAPELIVAHADQAGIHLTVTATGLLIEQHDVGSGEFLALTWPGAPLAGELGAPALPVVRRLFLAPIGAEVRVSSTHAQPVPISPSRLGDPFTVMPVQAPIPKIPGAREHAPFAYDAAAYTADALQPAARATVRDVGIARGERLMMLEVSPLAHNPVAGSLNFWPQIEVTVTFEGGRQPDRAYSALPGLDGAVLNPPTRGEDPRDQSGNYLIVVPTIFEPTIASFADFKTSQGFDVTTWEVSSGISAIAIRNYIEALYSNPATAPDYVLLVGDVDRIPCWTGAGSDNPPTDLYYVCMDGAGDWFPDLAVGRFSVADIVELRTVIEKTLSVASGTFCDPRYRQRAVFMASEDNWMISEGTHNYVISNHMDPHDIASDKLYSHTYSATTAEVRDAFNNGRLFGVYSGHGGTTGWSDGPPFSANDVRSLTNDLNYSWVSSFACLTGRFIEDECFMETWIRTPQAGAAVAMGSSVNSFWNEDDIMERKMFDLLYDSDMRELGPLMNSTKIGCLGGFGQDARRYFEMYNLMGDPSLYVPEPESMTELSGVIYDGHQGPLTASGSPYLVVGDLTVPAGLELTIEPHAQVQFVLDRKLTATGTLNVSGSSYGMPTRMYSGRAGIVVVDDASGPSVRVFDGGAIRLR